MRDRPLTDIKDTALEDHLRFIYENALDAEVQIVTTEPTTETLRPQDAPQKFGSDLYYNIEGSIFKTGLAAV